MPVNEAPPVPARVELLRKKGKKAYEDYMKSIPAKQRKILEWSPDFLLRPDQQLEQARGQHNLFLRSGRGAGKTAAGVGAIHKWLNEGRKSILIVTQCSGDLGSTIFADNFPKFLPPWLYDESCWNKSKNEIRFKNGAVARGASAERPNSLRGKSVDAVWSDEMGSYRYMSQVWDQIWMLLRERTPDEGDPSQRLPRFLVTTTPIYCPILRELEKMEHTYTRCVERDANSMLDDVSKSISDNLFAGTLWADQEIKGKWVSLDGEMLWKPSMFKTLEHKTGVDDNGMAIYTAIDKNADFDLVMSMIEEVVVGVDPSGSLSPQDKASDDVGIAVCARLKGRNKRYVVLEDCTFKDNAFAWTEKSIDLAEKWGATKIVVESYGSQKGFVAFYQANPRSGTWNVKPVAPKGDHAARAGPVAALYQQGRVYHARSYAGGSHDLKALEVQMCEFATSDFLGKGSPDRTDAVVHAISELASLYKAKFDSTIWMDCTDYEPDVFMEDMIAW